MKYRSAVLLSLLAAGICLSVESAAPAAGRGRAWEEYRVLIERNMFSRDRGTADTRPERTVVRAEPAPERYVLLRGVVQRGGEFVAVLEDMRSGELIRARAGDQIVRGRVSEVHLGGVRYVRGDTEVGVSVGENLEKAAPAAVPPTGEDTVETGQAPEPSPGPAGATDDILELMRQRRQRQLGQ